MAEDDLAARIERLERLVTTLEERLADAEDDLTAIPILRRKVRSLENEIISRDPGGADR